MLIHGLADDNVVVAHTLRLSGALLAAGYPHRVLPLSGITHMASQEAVAENLLLLQLDFLRDALGLAAFMIVSSFLGDLTPKLLMIMGLGLGAGGWKGRVSRTASRFRGP